MFTASRVPAVSRAIQRPSSTAAMTHEATPALPLISYVKVPYKDTFSDVGYVDVGSADDPVVIALHGAPGGVQDFAELYGPLAEKGIRFVVPEFPGIQLIIINWIFLLCLFIINNLLNCAGIWSEMNFQLFAERNK